MEGPDGRVWPGWNLGAPCVLGALCLVGALALLGGCGESTPPPAPRPGTATDPVALTWWAWTEDLPHQALGLHLRPAGPVLLRLAVTGADEVPLRAVQMRVDAGALASVWWSAPPAPGTSAPEELRFGFESGPHGSARWAVDADGPPPAVQAHDVPVPPAPVALAQDQGFELAVRALGRGPGAPERIRPRHPEARVLPPAIDGAERRVVRLRLYIEPLPPAR